MTSRAADVSVKYRLDYIIWMFLQYVVTIIPIFPTGQFLQQVQHATSTKPKLVESVEFIHQTVSGDHNETIMGLDSVYLLHT